MMCLAEALLRIPDAHTADELIADKLAGPDWADKLGESDSAFVNAATFSLLLTGKVLEGANDRTDNWRSALGRAVGRLGEPVVRAAVREAMKILGRNFVFGRTIDEALKRAAPERRQGLTHSFDMLGEAAKTFADAERYADAYRGALDRIAKEAKGGFKKSAGHFGQADRAPPALRIYASGRSGRRRAAGRARAGVDGCQGRRPFHDRCRRGRPARAPARRVRSAACRRRAVRAKGGKSGAGSGSPSRPIRSAPCPCANGSRRPPRRTAAS